MEEVKNNILQNKKEQVLGNIASIETTGFVDGPGVRVVVFMQGCPLRCLYCHNPEDAFFNTQRDMLSPQEIVKKVKRYMPYFGGGGGVTFSGGEPLNQPEFLLQALKLCKRNKINTAIDTSGCALRLESEQELYKNILKYTDLVILDVKAIDSRDYKALTGQEIKYFEQFLKLCEKQHKKLWIRQVIVPGINDTEESILKLKEFVKKIKNVDKIELLPYHDMAKEKYKKLKLKYRLEKTPPMDRKKCNELYNLLIS